MLFIDDLQCFKYKENVTTFPTSMKHDDEITKNQQLLKSNDWKQITLLIDSSVLTFSFNLIMSSALRCGGFFNLDIVIF